jgi:hypothetical protein
MLPGDSGASADYACAGVVDYVELTVTVVQVEID